MGSLRDLGRVLRSGPSRAAPYAITRDIDYSGISTPTTRLNDTFTGTDATGLASHTMDTGSGWTVQNGTWTIQSNKAVGSAGTFGVVTADAGAGHENAKVTVDITLPNAAAYEQGVALRVKDSTHFVGVLVGRVGGGTPFLTITEPASAWTVAAKVLVEVPAATNSTVTLTVTIYGSRIKATLSTGESCSWSTSLDFGNSALFGLMSLITGPFVAGSMDNFKVVDQTPMFLDVYKPLAAVSPVTMVAVHGGGWTSNRSAGLGQDRYDIFSMINHFQQYGFCIVNVEYRLVPASTGNLDTSYRDDEINQVRTAMTWARNNAAANNGNPNHICLFGQSASTQTTMMAAIRGTAGNDRPESLLEWSCFTDFRAFAVNPTIESYLGINADLSGAGQSTADAYSPYRQWPSSGMPPLRMAGFQTDLAGLILAQMTDMATLVAGLGGTVVGNTVNAAGHADFTQFSEMESAAAWVMAHT
jgi:acetyl esterase/lipase